MPSDAPSAEPVVSQIPTEELKKILTDRFARQVASETGKRLWRPVTLFGLPGIVLAATLVWQLLDTAITNKISAQLQDRQRTLEASLSSTMTTLFNTRAELSKLEAQTAIDQAFRAQHGAALGAALRQAAERPEFRQDLERTVARGLSDAWEQQGTVLREQFLQQLLRDEKFREVFARDVEQALGRAQAVPRIIAGALEESLLQRRADDGGQPVALALLASMDQPKANQVVLTMLERSRTNGHRDIAIGALVAAGFAGQRSDRPAPRAMLDTALAVWREHCTETHCTPRQPEAEAMSGFLRRGRDLPQPERETWVAALREWHEALIANPEAPAREASMGLVPRALGEIGSPEAITVLTGWAVAPDAELALSTSQAIAGLPADTLPDRERLALIRTLWPRVVEGSSVRAAVEEAAWMALGQVSDGLAESQAGPWAVEGALVQTLLGGQDRGGDLATWAAPSTRPGTTRPPGAPCNLRVAAEAATG
ncbi:hypothetical protein, partial [Falsiroseomonas oryzae]|uniref:hypothetical protein n=1 Tax=Falsiroseomonas oryzae TaxID=2766473 RepID=UPI0022EB1785